MACQGTCDPTLAFDPTILEIAKFLGWSEPGFVIVLLTVIAIGLIIWLIKFLAIDVPFWLASKKKGASGTTKAIIGALLIVAVIVSLVIHFVIAVLFIVAVIYMIGQARNWMTRGIR